MATIDIPWNDGTGDKIHITSASFEGNQTVSVSSDVSYVSARTKDVVFSTGSGGSDASETLTVTQAEGGDIVAITYDDVCVTYNDVGIGHKPYDSAVEYLESSGNGSYTGQVINSNILIPQDCTHVEYHFKFMFTKNQKGVLCGHQEPGYQNPRCYILYTSSATPNRVFYAGNNLGGVAVQPLVVVDGYVTVDTVANKLEFYIDDVLQFSHALSGTVLNKNYPIRIFGGCYGNALDDLSSIKLYRFSIIHGENLVRDFIPVRVGQVGYLYDKVDGGLYANSGTGSFLFGQDI